MIRSIKILFVVELLILTTYFYSFIFFINLQVASASALFVILGASYAYKKMVDSQVASGNYEEKRDTLDETEDPYGLYDEEPINEASVEELDLKAIVKEEKAKIKTFSTQSIKQGARGSVSLFRIMPYVFLALGFIALKNNDLLNLTIYLPSLLVGIITGSIVTKGVMK